MKQRIIELEEQLVSQPPPAKRARKAAAAADDDYTESAPAAAATAAASSSKADEKKIKIQMKKIFDRLKKEAKSDTCKFQGSPKHVKVDEVLEVSEFEALFGGKGVLIQPTPQNKPKSVVTIIEFQTQAQIEELFGSDLSKQLPIKGNYWSRGGIPVRAPFRFGGFGGNTMSKSVKQGAIDVRISHIEVNYSKNNMKCTLKFTLNQIGGGGCGYDSDY
ncbi:hypothetical protein BOTBODRAFT_468595 [Botryobasidium botryosum FD-172 SS1]|uniref:Uncharacterized protein n=1 Tax=Botryobasidium botryosum (strain FD-172 SS1) TaxID=930990 RepID=A0A067MGZ2_BOTB1|nr:hypothetical protein BOTBODRAFT_468595 [Botryobasidium botryosum FD-172 SS1]